LFCALRGLGGCLTAQTPSAVKAPTAPAAKKSAFDKAELEFYLRHRNLWPAGEVKVEIGDPKPSRTARDAGVTVR